jgi:hypothetical protein
MMATKKVKKFGRGGDILTGLGAVLMGKALYDKFSSKDEKETTANLKTIAGPSRSESRTPVQDTDERFPVKSKESAAPKKSESYDANEGQDRTPAARVKAAPAAQNTKVKPVASRYEGQSFPTGNRTASGNESTSGSGPKNTFLTKERLDKAQDSMRRYREDQQKKQRGVSDIQYDTMGNPVMKKGGKVKKYADGGTATTKPEAPRPEPKKDSMPEWAKNERENKARDERNKREGKGAEQEVKRNMSTFGYKKGGSVSSASKRADGCAIRGKTRGKVY